MSAGPARTRSPAYAIAEASDRDWTYNSSGFLAAWPRQIAAVAACLVMAIAVVVLAGWTFDVGVAKSILPGQAKMAPATALGFLSCGIALLALVQQATQESVRKIQIIAVRSLAGLIVLIGIAKLGDHLQLWNLQFDTLYFSDTATIAPATALAFVLVGTALSLARSERFFALFQGLVLATAFVSWLGVTSYISGGERLPVYAQMALHTSLTFLCLSLGILCSRTDRGLVALLTSQGPAGKNTLWLLLLAPPLPFVFDLADDFVARTRLFGTINLSPLYSTLDMVLLIALIWIFGARLKSIDERRTREQAKRREYETRLALFVEHAPAAIAMFDKNMRYLAVSSRWLADNRLSLEDIRGRCQFDVFPDLPQRWLDSYQRSLAGNIEKSDRDRIHWGDGRADWIRWEIRPVESADGNIDGIIQFTEIITQRVDAESKAKRLNRVYAMLSGINSLIVRVQDKDALFDEACRLCVKLGGFSAAWIGLHHRAGNRLVPAAAAGLSPGHALLSELGLDTDSDGARGLPARAIATGDVAFDNDLTKGEGNLDEQTREMVKSGYRAAIALPLIVDSFPTGCLSLWSRQKNVFDKDELRLLLEVANDIAFAVQYLTKQEELNYVSYYDVLTGLPNRALFLDRIGQELRGREDHDTSVAVVMVDVERFRIVNESLGRHGGDELLRGVARRLKALHAESTLARIGPNSFAIGMPDVKGPADVISRLESTVVQTWQEPFAILGTEIRVAAKAGVAIYPSDGNDSDELFRNAEAALKRAKDTGEPYLFYGAEMNAQAESTLILETRLRKAVESNEFILHYQPKVRLDTSEMSGLEALIRWDDPERGLVPPGDFIPLLETTGLIVDVGYWAIRQALSDHGKWVAAGYSVPRVAVNVSAVQLQREDFAGIVLDLMPDDGAGPEALELEVTESLMMKNVERSNRELSVLRGTGVHVSLDDFGTGYSSFRYLAGLPIDKIKIDRSFISGMTDNVQDHRVVSTIISLAHSFGLPVVAEGVETVEQAKALHRLGCDEAQGFLFSKPVPFDQVIPLFGDSADCPLDGLPRKQLPFARKG